MSFKAREPFPNSVMKDPEKNRLDWDAFGVMDNTSGLAPASPPKAGGPHELDWVLHTATAGEGDEKRPPTHTLSPALSQ